MRMRRAAVPVLLLALFLGARAAITPVARPALGYVAKVTCSQVFVGGLSPDAAIAELPDLLVTRLIRTKVDPSAGRVRASLPLITHREAIHHGFGCTLVPTSGEMVSFPAGGPGAVPGPDTSGRTWPEGDLVEPGLPQDVDSARLVAALDRAFAEPDPGMQRRTRAIVVVHRGRIIAERYADGFSHETRFPGWSMTKSVGSALVGILVGEGRLRLDSAALFPQWRGAGDPRRAITLNQLMWMSDGLAHDERYTPTGGATQLLFGARDIAATAGATRPRSEPGTTWYYASAASNLISQLVREAVGGTLIDYLGFPNRVLFDRIGMRSAVMEPDATGLFVASSFMYATARDWARFGLLYLRDGVWNGERILPEGWVRYSVTPAPAAPLGEYGGQWWLNAGAAADSTRRPFPGLPREFYRASGFEGQMVGIVPSADLVVVRLGLSRPDEAFDPGQLVSDVLAALAP
ncbi:MAG: beta-lactamase family protein [Gemmatimonadota bacterium]|jgi:CubicO group peptidase (beta-lactamase class C family)|nr:beta-lactamase family protein [Gemmatimonadota bacterium]